MSVHTAGSSIPPFDPEKAKKLLQAQRPWTPDDFVCAGLYFRDYGYTILALIEAAQTICNLFDAEQLRLAVDQRHALEDLKLELQILGT